MSQEITRILLIDDEESDYLMTRALLGQIEGPRMEVEWASTFDDGLRQLALHRHDLCLLDYFLDERSGVELLRQARSRGIRTPVILLTGKGNREVDLEAMKAGAVDYLQKGANDPDAVERSIRYAVERHRAQEELRRSEERHRAMFDHLPLGLYRVTAEGDYMEANPALIRTLEFPDREMLRNVLARNFFVSPKDREEFLQSLFDQGVLLGFESEIRTSTGRPIRVRSTARVHRGPAGRIEYVEGTVEDVTGSRAGREQELEAASFDAIVSACSAGVVIADAEGRVQRANPAMANAVGSSVKALEGRAIWDLFEADAQARVARAFEEVSGGLSDLTRSEAGVVGGDGRSISTRVAISAISTGDGSLGGILVLVEGLPGGADR